jgi:murein DD-endopeptidase MepM/ murein hydrolase activator NlpD
VGSLAASGLTASGGAAREPSEPVAVDSGTFRRLPLASSTAVSAEAPRLPAPASHPDSASPIETIAPVVPEPPLIVRFRPLHGTTGVPRTAEVSIRFTEPMDPASSSAFHALVDGMEVAGTYRWADNGTVLVLRPSAALPFGARVQLLADTTARSAAGLALPEARSVTFTVAPKPPPRATPTPAAPRPAAPAPSSDGWQWPLLGPITQRFGESLTVYGFHQGLDINGETGDPVRAARGGRVKVAGYWDECGGLQVQLDHGGGVESWYRHFSRVDVAVGASVSAGTVIGAVGETGCAFGSHLHFAIRVNGTFVDPLRYLPPR